MNTILIIIIGLSVFLPVPGDRNYILDAVPATILQIPYTSRQKAQTYGRFGEFLFGNNRDV